MYRILKKTFYFILLVGLPLFLLSALFFPYKEWRLNRKSTIRQNDNGGVTTSFAYSIKRDNWIVFPLKKGARLVKVIANPQCVLGPEKKIMWILEYELLDHEGAVLVSKQYNEFSKINLYRKRHTKRILSNPFLFGKNRYLGTSYEIIIPLTDKRAEKIRFNWKSDNMFMSALTLRLIRPIKILSQKNEIKWYRLPIEKKKELAKGNIYPQFYLTQLEKFNLLRTKWSLVSPLATDFASSYEEVRLGTFPKKCLKKIKGDFVRPPLEEKDNDLLLNFVNSRGNGIFREPSQEELEKAYTLFCLLFKDKKLSKEIKEKWNALGMKAEEIRSANIDFIVVYEDKMRMEGRGFYLFCKSSYAKKLAIEAPHRLFDKQTGVVAYFLMLTGYYTAGAWNSVHRYQTPNHVENSSDMARNPNTYFNSFTRAFLASCPEESALIQLHGFNAKSHSHKNFHPTIVISEGKNSPSKNFMLYANTIKNIFHTNVFIYPGDDLKNLSGKENITIGTFEKYSKGQAFIHMEMSEEIRNLLIQNNELRYNLSAKLSLVTPHE